MQGGWKDFQSGKVGGAQLFRDGLMIASLAQWPGLRLRNTKPVLGYASLASSQASYKQTTSFTAVGRLDAVLTGLSRPLLSWPGR